MGTGGVLGVDTVKRSDFHILYRVEFPHCYFQAARYISFHNLFQKHVNVLCHAISITESSIPC